jgi:ribonuclease HI
MVHRMVDIYTDGACINNGLPDAKGGMGVFSEELDIELSVPWEMKIEPTNQRCEMGAVVYALLAIKEVEQEKDTVFQILSDSEYVVKGMNEWMKQWKNRGWKTAKGKEVKNRWLWELLDSNSKEMPVIFKHVRGHSGVPGNEKADSLAMSAAETLNV